MLRRIARSWRLCALSGALVLATVLVAVITFQVPRPVAASPDGQTIPARPPWVRPDNTIDMMALDEYFAEAYGAAGRSPRAVARSIAASTRRLRSSLIT